MSTKISSVKTSYSPKPAKKELVGIEWNALNTQTTTVTLPTPPFYQENTLYSPVDGVEVIFDITPEKFEVAAGFNFEGSDLFGANMIEQAPIVPNNLPAVNIEDYYIRGSATAEGYARDAANDGYAESFFTDEVEIFLGLVNDHDDADPTDDEVIGSIEVEIDFTRKVDILLNGGLGVQGIQQMLGSLGSQQLLGLIEGIDIKYQANNPADPLMATVVIPVATAVAELVAENIPSQLASLISIEADDVSPSKWAAGAFGKIATQFQSQPIDG